MAAERLSTVWFGPPPDSAAREAFTQRRLAVEVIADPRNIQVRLPASRGIVIPLSNWNLDVGKRLLREAIVPALRHGCIPVLIANLADVTAIKRWLGRLHLARSVDLIARSPATSQLAAETVARHAPGPAFVPTLLVEGEEALSDEEKILLRRAFFDASHVSLQALESGKTSLVYCAYARIPASRVGSRPLPFFVKFDRHPKIVREFNNYSECAVNYVPFNLRPNVEHGRLALGTSRGVLVGNFVEHSESLWEVISRGAGVSAINSLFELTLRGWRLQAYQPDADLAAVNQPLSTSMGGALPSNIGPGWTGQLERRAQEASSIYGARCHNYKDLARRIDSLPSFKHRISFTHGDLHGENVRVRGGDAILIDLASVTPGPLAADPATLDVWLGFANTHMEFGSWKTFATSLYSFASLHDIPVPQGEPTLGHEVWNAVRQIRRIAAIDKVNKHEYATAIAIALLRRTCHADDYDGNQRRIFGYFLADQIVQQIESNP